MSNQATDLMLQVQAFIDGLSDEQRAEVSEFQFTAIRREPKSDEPSICFELVASVPFGSGKATKLT